MQDLVFLTLLHMNSTWRSCLQGACRVRLSFPNIKEGKICPSLPLNRQRAGWQKQTGERCRGTHRAARCQQTQGRSSFPVRNSSPSPVLLRPGAIMASLLELCLQNMATQFCGIFQDQPDEGCPNEKEAAI